MTKDTRTRFTLRLPCDLMNLIVSKANTYGLSVNSMILKILWEWESHQPRGNP